MAKQKKSGSRPSRAKASASKTRLQPASRSIADKKVAQFRRQLAEARNQLSASTEVLQLISSTSGSLRPVFDVVLQRALKLCEAAFGFVTIYDGKRFDPVAQHGVPDALADYFAKGMDQPRPGEAHARLLAGEDLVHNLDQRNEDVYRNGSPLRRAIVDLGGVRSALVVALRKDGVLLGALTIYRKEVRAFSQRQIGMLQNFAAQAAIAIANARLLENVQAKSRDLSEALTHQTASANVLRVIASSPTDIRPVLNAIVESACQLCQAYDGIVRLRVGDRLQAGAHYGQIPISEEEWPIDRDSVSGLAILERRPVHVHDMQSVEGDRFPESKARALRLGYRTILSVPLVRDGTGVGVIALRRIDADPFSRTQIAILQSFADQAVIAIENARLFNETQEALERQTATADVLGVIASSPSNLQPVFDAIAQRSNQLIGGHSTAVYQFVEGVVHLAAFTPVNPEADAALRNSFPTPLSDLTPFARVLEGETVHQSDVLSAESLSMRTEAGVKMIKRLAAARGFRSCLFVPLTSEQGTIGMISVTRKEVGLFAQHHVDLLKTFASQAVIAIQNVALFDEVQAKTRDLEESLQQQTATADVLKVISRSAFDLDSVLSTLVESAAQLCEAERGVIFLRDGDNFRLTCNYGYSADFEAYAREHPLPADGPSTTARAAASGKPVQAVFGPDDPPSEYRRLGGFRANLGVPLRQRGEVIGVFTLTRLKPIAFTERQVELVGTFADQAVIAIENTRLLTATSEALERQTATADILKVIASSPTDLQPVFDAIAERSNQLIGGFSTAVYRYDGSNLHLTAFTRVNPEADAVLQQRFPRPISEVPELARVVQGETLEYSDILVAPGVTKNTRTIARARGFRSCLFVPLVGDGGPIGLISVTRKEVGPFPEKHIELLKTFASQAVIAIANVSLFEQVQQRTRELSESLDELRTAQDRLVQTEKLASLGQLTAGIAHEIKNPLNFVNNFSSLSVELIDEMTDAIAVSGLDQTKRVELEELAQTLKGNLQKIEQHGKRADSIVKNMLLHSREGSGEQHSIDVNAIVDESLSLAYHGARAEKPGFNITLERNFDPGVGVAQVFPQEITRVLLNIISNGFYAATRRAIDAPNGFGPVLSAQTRNLGDNVEIRIRDNGIGMPDEVKARIFTPFFTTKPPGEGTGLGLSMSHDIIVKQHGGSIDVRSEPGAFTEFIIKLPRRSAGRTSDGDAR